MKNMYHGFDEEDPEILSGKKESKVRRLARRGLTIGICALVITGTAVGSGVFGHAVTTVMAEEEKQQVTLLKDAEPAEHVKGGLDVSDIAAEAMPSVVSITSKSVQEIENYYGFMFGYGYAPETVEREVEGGGSGIILGKNETELLMATNYHVVEGANSLSVCFVDGSAYEAKVKGYDSVKDLAVIAIPLEDVDQETLDAISIAKFGNSDELVVGEQVIAIGNAMGYGQSVTTGIVSAKNRRMDSETVYSDVDDEDNLKKGVNLIQTDAAINPGNSGGALLNMNGEVVGINSAKLASTEVEGMGYAIAITDVEGLLENLMNEEPRERLDDDEHGMLGIVGSTVSQEAMKLYGIPQGVYVQEVSEGGGAEAAGMKKNCVIVELDGKSVTTIQQLIELLSYYEPGETVTVLTQSQTDKGYEEETFEVTLGENEDKDKTDSKDNEDKEDKDEDRGESRNFQDYFEDEDEMQEFFEEWEKFREDKNNERNDDRDSAFDFFGGWQ